MPGIYSLGELLIDFVCLETNVDLIDSKSFVKKAGGAPANVVAMSAKLGVDSYFAGAVGRDSFGFFLQKVLLDNKINCTDLKMLEDYNTTLAFVSLKDDGERDFIFNRGADEHIKFNQLSKENISKSNIAHFGSATALLGGDLEHCYYDLINSASHHDIFVSFDPNFRSDLWHENVSTFISKSFKCFEKSDFVKLSLEESEIITGESDKNAAAKILHECGVRVVAITLGGEGTFISNGSESDIVPSIKVKSIDSTSAGDAFVGAFLYRLSKASDIFEYVENFSALKEDIVFANKAGALTCTKYGAMEALPTLEEIEKFK